MTHDGYDHLRESADNAADAARFAAPKRIMLNCEVCGDSTGKCVFSKGCSCWHNEPCTDPGYPDNRESYGTGD